MSERIIEPFVFPSVGDYLNRSEDLARMEDWWSGRETNALAVYGRRRVGKSWLFRRFAHGKPALVFVADRRTRSSQLDRFAERLRPLLGFRPSLDDVPALIEALYTLAAERKTLVVIDEFPFLLPDAQAQREDLLTSIQSVMEERDASKLKLMICGSYIGLMEKLLRGPLRGRLTPLAISPLAFPQAAEFMAPDVAATEAIERYAVAGGMSLHLSELGPGSTLRRRICQRALDPRGPLFNDPREVLEEELRTPGTYFSLLEELSTGTKSIGELASALGRRTTDLPGYLKTLQEMQVIERYAPVAARGDERNNRYGLRDGFIRFWFRFIFPFQEDLKAGLSPGQLFDDEIAPELADHVSPVYEDLCRRWARGPGATKVGGWWGNALNEHRRVKARQTEEVDVVGLRRGSVTLVGECKWTAAEMSAGVLTDLETYKLPAMRQAKVRFAKSGPQIVLFAKRGFSRRLREIDAERDDITLVSVDELVSGLLGGPGVRA